MKWKLNHANTVMQIHHPKMDFESKRIGRQHNHAREKYQVRDCHVLHRKRAPSNKNTRHKRQLLPPAGVRGDPSDVLDRSIGRRWQNPQVHTPSNTPKIGESGAVGARSPGHRRRWWGLNHLRALPQSQQRNLPSSIPRSPWSLSPSFRQKEPQTHR